jgi:hypothetical protein
MQRGSRGGTVAEGRSCYVRLLGQIFVISVRHVDPIAEASKNYL